MIANLKRMLALWIATGIAAAILARPAWPLPPAQDEDALFEELAQRSYPPHYDLRSFYNPWGEDLIVHNPLPENFGTWVVAAARVYASQKIRFDGYLGSEDDGRHYLTAADGLDNAYYGDPATHSYRVVENGEVDDLTERTMICLDLPVHAITLAGYPLREAMVADWQNRKYEYTLGGAFPENAPETEFFFRRVRNIRTFFRDHQKWVELEITKDQFRDPAFRPAEPFMPGDLVIFGHYGDPEDTGGVWHPKHSGIVATVDDRGLPVKVYNMRVSKNLLDYYDGTIDQTRTIDGKEVFFERFSDRYSLIGFGRIIHPYTPALESLEP